MSDCDSQLDDLPHSEQTIPLEPEEFETVHENVEGKGIDRWVGVVVRDGNSRIALVRNRWSDGWVLPGGDVEPGETLREAVVREVREETGVPVAVERPLEVVEQAFTHGDRSVSGRFVVFEARTTDPELGEDLGVDDDEIEAAGWFGEVPDECEYPSLVARHL